MNRISWRSAPVCVLGALAWAPSAALAETTVFGCTGYAQYFVVPSNVFSLNVRVVGAGGAIAVAGAAGSVDATLAVIPNQVLTVKVGCQPRNPLSSFTAPVAKAYNAGGWGYANGGDGGSDDAGGGGGASGIATVSGQPLVVAGGGGGPGESSRAFGVAGPGGAGGTGGASAGSPGGGTQPGAGGSLGGNAAPQGSTGQAGGAAGTGGAGGGGGGGYPRGGAGGAAGGAASGGGGGGGGASFTHPSRATRVVLGSVPTNPNTGIPDDGTISLTYNGALAPSTTFLCNSGFPAAYTIPAGAKALRVIAIGASGGNTPALVNLPPVAGGGQGLEATIPASAFPASRQLVVVAGCPGGDGVRGDWFSASAPGGAGGGGLYSGGPGGAGAKQPGTQPGDGATGGAGGGGASGIFGTGNLPLIAAAGGGGTGGEGFLLVVRNAGGNGGLGSLGTPPVFPPAANGTSGGGTGGGAGGDLSRFATGAAGGAAQPDSNAGGGGGGGGGMFNHEPGTTAVGGDGGSGLAAGGGGGSGGRSGAYANSVALPVQQLDLTTYRGRGIRSGRVIIVPLFELF